MSLPVQIKDGEGSSRTAGVTAEKAVKVSLTYSRPGDVDPSLLTAKRVYRAYLTNAAGSPLMVVDGSSTPVVFSAMSVPATVISITGVRFLIESTQANIGSIQSRGFGAAASSPGLTNGLLFGVTQLGVQTSIFLNPVKQLNDFLDYCDKYESIPGAVAPGVDYLNFDVNFDQPVVLPAGTQDAVSVTIQDNFSAFTSFRVLIRGWKESI